MSLRGQRKAARHGRHTRYDREERRLRSAPRSAGYISGLSELLSHLVFRWTDARALLHRAPPFIWLSEVYAILDAFSPPIKQVGPPACLPGCIHRYIPTVIHCAPSHNSFAAPYLPNPQICAGGANVPFLERHGSRLAEPLIPCAFSFTEHKVMAFSLSSVAAPPEA